MRVGRVPVWLSNCLWWDEHREMLILGMVTGTARMANVVVFVTVGYVLMPRS